MKVALVGNQNCGKTTLFNLLTGMNQKIGNWPGVTLEKKSGIIKGTRHELIDLPGIYSLNPYTIEEKVSRDFLLNYRPDLIINIIDVTSIERGLYLTTQLLDLDTKVIVVLNMADRLKKKGLRINVDELKRSLGVSVCMVSALKEEGIDELINLICNSNGRKLNKLCIFPRDIEEIILNLESRIENSRNKRFNAIEMLESGNSSSVLLMRDRIEKKYNMDIFETLISLRYEYISNVCKRCIERLKVRKNITGILDKLFLNKFLSIPIFVFIMFLMYFLSVGIVGDVTSEFVNNSFDYVKDFIQNFLHCIGTSDWIVSLVCNGIVAGVGSVLSFLPQLIILFLCISVLEATGYMSRIAFLLDKFFRKIGLSGKALIPFIVGTGCSVPGVMSTRIIENEYDRKVSAIITPFVPCSAKLPVITLFTSYFFSENKTLIAMSFYVLSVIIIIVSSLIINKFIKRKYASSYISELPEYKLPSVKYVMKDVWDKVKEFIKKAGTVIFLSSICVWFLLSFSTKFEYGVDIEDSILAFMGKKIEWFFYPIIGRNSWEVCVSALQGFIAKEQVVSSMEIISGLSNDIKNSSEVFGNGSPFEFFGKASGYAFVAFNLFSAPCFAAVATIKKELKSFKQTFLVVCFQIGIAWISSSCIFGILNALGV